MSEISTVRKPPGYFKNRKNAEDEIKNLIKNLGYIPYKNELERWGYDQLVNAIGNYHGGYSRFLEDMRYIPKRKSVHYFKNIENVKKEFQKAAEKLGHSPTQVELRNNGHGDLAHGINKYHGGLRKFKEEMGERYNKLPNDYLKNKNNVESEVRKLIEKYGRFPTHKEFVKNHKTSLVASITKYHGGIRKFRNTLGYPSPQLPSGYYKNKDNVVKEVERIKNILGRVPASPDLGKINASLLTAIKKYHGGYRKLREDLGYNINKLPNGYWKDWENFEKEVKSPLSKFYSQNKRLPKIKELIEIVGNATVYDAIRFYGGIDVVYSRLGYLPQNLTTENFVNLVENDKNLKEIMKRIGDDPVTLYDVLAVKYGSIMQRKDFVKLFKESSLRGYLGNFVKPISGTNDLIQLAEHALPFDKEGKIKNILIKKGMESILEQLGPNPSEYNVQSKLKELEKSLGTL